MLKTNSVLLLLLGVSNMNAMELPASSERRPIEESMFELLVQDRERIAALEGANCQLSASVLEQTAAHATQRVYSAVGQLLVDNESRKQNSELRQNQAAITSTVFQTATIAARSQASLLESIASHKQDISGINARTRMQLALQQEEIALLRAQIRESREQQGRTEVALAKQEIINKWLYISGVGVALAAGVALARLQYKVNKLEAELFGVEKNQEATKGLMNTVNLLKDRPYVSKDHNNALVYNSPAGRGPVRGAHVSSW